MKEFQLRYFKVVDWSCFADMKMEVKDRLLVRVEEFECVEDGVEVAIGNLMELRKVAYIKKSANAQDKPLISTIRNQRKDISLYVPVFAASNLL